MTLPLASLRVLDLTRALAGPFCTMILGDLGADVIKVEAMPGGDMARDFGPHQGEDSLYFASVNRNKRSVALDFRAVEGQALLHELVAGTDILVENFRPGVTAQLGLDYETLAPGRPELIYASVSGFGRGGPYEAWPGLDQIAQGMSGLMSLTGNTGEQLRSGIPLADVSAGMWAAIAVLSAVVQRTATGAGQWVETALLGGLIGMLCVQGQRYLSTGEVPVPAGNDHPVIAPYGAFAAADGLLNIAAPTEGMWRALCRVLDLPELAADPRFADGGGRMAHRDVLQAAIDARLQTRPKADWARELIAAGVPAGPVLSLDEVFADPHVRATQRVETVQHPRLGVLRQLANPVTSVALRGNTVRRPPPLLGEHTLEVLREFGVAEQRVAALVAGGWIRAG